LSTRECHHQIDGTDSAADNITWIKVFGEIAYHLLKPGSFWELIMNDGFDVLVGLNLPELPFQFFVMVALEVFTPVLHLDRTLALLL